MRGKLSFGAGVGVGYLLGTRAGRQRFEQIMGKAKQFKDSKTVRDAASTVQEQAGRLYEGGKQKVSDQAHRMRMNNQHDKSKHHRPMGATERKDTSWEPPVGYPVNTSY